MSRTIFALPLLAALLLPLTVKAAPPAPAPAKTEDAGNMPIPATPGPLDLVLFHNPGCHICQRIVALRPDMLKLNPKLRVILRNNTIPGAMDKAKELRKLGKIPAESWGPATAVFLGDDWATASGRALLKKLHVMLGDRAEVDTAPWTGDSMAGLGAARGRMAILADFRAVVPVRLALHGLTDALSFPLVVAVFCLLGSLVLAPGAPRALVAWGLSYWAGAVVLLAGYGLGALGPVFAHRTMPLIHEGSVAFYLALGVGFLGVAAGRWRAFRRMALASPAPADEGEAEGGGAARVRTLQEPGAVRNRVVGGLLLGLAVTFLALLINPPSTTSLLAEAWNLGDVSGRVLQLLACYLGAATAPLLLTALLAGALPACPSVRRHGLEQPADYRFAAFVFFLVVGAFLLAQAVITLGFYSPGG